MMGSFSDFVMARCPPLETLDWLRGELLKQVQENLNLPERRARLGLYNGEVIPTNERNLTDSRNRVSLIYEYLLADEITRLLSDNGGEELCAYVVANRFPDLEIRSRNGERGLRLEVKCLQTTAEEKAANFSTLLKDIDPATDYAIVCLWEWGYDASEVNWDRAPLLIEIYAFHAESLARLRDWYWLNRPSAQQGAAYQGYDLRGAITSKNDEYKEEEGNYGKLLRLWDARFAIRPKMSALLEKTEQVYVEFREAALHSGFESLSKLILRSIIDEHELSPIIFDSHPIGFQRGRHWFILESKIGRAKVVELMRSNGADDVILFSDKYQWIHCKLDGIKLVSTTDRAKPKHLPTYLNTEFSSHPDEDLRPADKA